MNEKWYLWVHSIHKYKDGCGQFCEDDVLGEVEQRMFYKTTTSPVRMGHYMHVVSLNVIKSCGFGN